ncbi:Biotin synthase [Leptospira borgpetersenii serovar Hardjo-bovis str. L550]|uniref:Biotin synthase n=3 Tax=Leptospira borgpetersenii serovar Hardjo-bovis TaxID=338217 RepID=BIOB_LEPBJ|nr:RecName: Full=Biotin synthase [Leptospira borgpetersenii serovar Hardjo-bovis str. JB197]Q051U2.1 RecName: Full=Biotin synthase [Leptospira borgpetersenii serovar Hardjo-bovis str. L550]ABJ76391.1 Biotin synthase [Leptospira borgpetersenii serovar Hardjo-bovis str. JB197]ABJ78903.1 Biotin synthase [Leptospira borgpetersenii serovar Hardjo-bovis str. L550]
MSEKMYATLKTAEKIFSEISSVITKQEGLEILNGSIPLTTCLDKAFQERNRYFYNKVRIHILDNIKNGYCPEDCGYCAQRKNANSGIKEYPMKSEAEIYEDAVQAKKNGAYRFCMVTSGTGPNRLTTERLASTIRRITNELGMKVCLSAGLLDEEKAQVLKSAGLDRYNHNLNTSENHYPEICDTHTYAQRTQTLDSVSKAGIGMCSGVIVGMGESFQDIVDMAFELKSFRVISIPVNFFIPVKGHAIKNPGILTPELCVRILCLFRLVNPDSEIRIAAGREGHLRSLSAMALFAANSLFSSGYLNVKGSEIIETVTMIRDAGFVPELVDGGILPEESGTEMLYSEKNFPELYKFKKS